jgi:hypothetical protein
MLPDGYIRTTYPVYLIPSTEKDYIASSSSEVLVVKM